MMKYEGVVNVSLLPIVVWQFIFPSLEGPL